MKNRTKVLSFLLSLCILFSTLSVTVLAIGETQNVTEEEKTDAMPAIREAFSEHKMKEVSLAEDGYLGIGVTLVLYYAKASEDFVYSYNGTPIVLYVVNTLTERVGTDSDVKIIGDMLERGYLVLVVDYKNAQEAVSPGLDWSLQQLRARTLAGEFFGDTKIDPTGKFTEGYVVPAGHTISDGHIFWEIDKHGADGSLEKIVEIWNNDFRGVKGETVVYWLDSEGNKKATQKALDGTDPVWVDDSHIKIKYTKAETIYDCVKADGSFIDLNLYMTIVYPTNPKEEVPVFCYASCGENLLRFWNVSYGTHLTGFLFAGYAGVIYDYCYTPMARNDHYGYFDGDAMKGHITGDNQTYSLDVYNEKKTNTAALRYIRYLADTQSETFAFDTEHIGVIGHSKSGVVTLLGTENPELLAETRFFPGHHGETRYENGITADDEYGLIDGGEAQPWLTYQDGSPIPSRANFVCASACSRGELIVEGHAPTFIVGAEADDFYMCYPRIRNQLETYDIPALYLSVADLGHQTPHGTDREFGLDTYWEFFKFAHYWLRGDAAECVWITPTQGTEHVGTTDKISIKFNGTISYEEIQKVSVVNRENGKIAGGEWKSSFGDTLWEFYPEALDGGCVYTVTVPDTIVDSTNGKTLAKTKKVSFRTRYEVSDAPVLFGENMCLTMTDTDSTGAYFLFDKTPASDRYLIRLQVNNDAHNKLCIYLLDNIDKDNLKNSTYHSEPMGELLLSGKGYYDFDLSDAIRDLDGTFGVYLALGKNVGESVVFLKDFDSSEVGNYKLPKDLYYENQCDGVISDDMESVSLRINAIVPNGDRTVAGKDYAAKYVNNVFYENPRPALTIGATFNPVKIIAEDYGRTFRFSIRIFDTTSRLVSLKVGELSVMQEGENVIDFKPMQYSFYTKANEWCTFEFDFTLDNPAYWNGLSKNKVTLYLNSTGDENYPLYIDDITVTETVSNVTLGEVSLVSYPTKDEVFVPIEQVAFDGDGNPLDALVLGADKATYQGHGAKAYVQYATTNIDLYASNYIAAFHIATDASARVKVYGLSEDVAWNADTLNSFNAIANDRFASGVDLSKVYLGKPVATLEVNETGVYHADITEYVDAMRQKSAKNITLILVAEDATNLMKLTPVGGEIVFYENYESGTWKRIYPSDGNYEFGDYDLITRGTEDYPTLASRNGLTTNVTPFGKDSMRMRFPSSATAIKFFNMFGKNLTEEDIGDTYTIRFFMTTDAENFTVRYGLMSATGRYASPYTGDKLYNPITNKASSANKELLLTLTKDKWTEVEFTFAVTEQMIGSLMNQTNPDGTGITHCNYALLAFIALTPDANVNVFIDDILVEKHAEKASDSEYGIVSSFDYDNTTLNTFPTTKVNNISLGVDEYCPDYTSVVRSTSKPTLSSEYDHTTGNGKSLVMTMDNKNAMLKIPNLFGKNLTEEDIGDYYTISLWVNTDIESMRFGFGFASSTTEYVSPYTGDKTYNPILDKNTSVLTPTIKKDTWTKISFTFPITEKMVGSIANQTFEYNGETYTVHCNFALLVFRCWFDDYTAGGEYVNSHLYIDDITVARTLADGTLPASEAFIVEENGYTSVSGEGDTHRGVVGGNTIETQTNKTTAYFTFDKATFTDCERATLSVPFVGESSVTVSVFGVKNPLMYDGVFSREKMYQGAPIDTAKVGEDGTLRLDVTEYVRENHDTGYGFVLVCESIGGAECIGMNMQNITLTPELDYTLTGGTTATQTDGAIILAPSATGEGILFYNIFGTQNAAAEVGALKVQVTVKNTATTDASFAIVLADKNGHLLFTSKPHTLAGEEEKVLTEEISLHSSLVSAGACAIGIISTGGTAFAVSTLNVSMENNILLGDGATLIVATPSVDNASINGLAPLSNITLYTDFVYNVYFPVLDSVKSLTLDGVEYTDLDTVPQQMVNDKMYYAISLPLSATEAMRSFLFTVTLEKEDGKRVVGKWTMSIGKYATSLLAGDYTETEKTLMRDILSYIRSAYVFFAEEGEEDLLASVLAQINVIIGEDYDTVAKPDTTYAGSEVTSGLSAATLLIDTAPAFAFLPKTDSEGNLLYALEKYHFYVDGKACAYKMVTLEDGNVAFILDMYAYMMTSEVTWTVDGTDLSGSYHLYFYYEFAKKSGDEKLVSIVERLWKYAESARLYREETMM